MNAAVPNTNNFKTTDPITPLTIAWGLVLLADLIWDRMLKVQIKNNKVLAPTTIIGSIPFNFNASFNRKQMVLTSPNKTIRGIYNC